MTTGVSVTSPLTGHVIGLAAVPDPVFSGAMVVPGTATEPHGEFVEPVASVDGIIVSLHAHAFVAVEPSGKGVLGHLAIDTVQLDGEGLEMLVAKGDNVSRAAPTDRWSLARVLAFGQPRPCPVLTLETAAGALGDFAARAGVNSDDRLFHRSQRQKPHHSETAHRSGGGHAPHQSGGG